MMRGRFLLIFVLLVVLVALPAAAAGPVTHTYDDRILYNWGAGSFSEVWDLTQCDLTLSYTIDMSGITNPGWSISEVGLHEVGAPNLDPNYRGGWLLSRYAYAASNNNTRDNNDYHALMKHGWLDEYYDAEGPETLLSPMTIWQYINHAFWFDRDGVDPWQETFWGYIDGVTYNTGGVYDVVITYHALDGDTATMFATVNGESQGFYLNGWKNATPEKMPMGRSFGADMTKMQVFYGRGGGGGTVALSDISVTGCPYVKTVSIDIKPGSCPNSINLKSKGVIPVAILTTEDFDASMVDPVTAHFAGAVPLRWVWEDVDRDGDVDMLFHFKTQELNLADDSTMATLTAHTMGGLYLKGTDTVNIVPKGKH